MIRVPKGAGPAWAQANLDVHEVLQQAIPWYGMFPLLIDTLDDDGMDTLCMMCMEVEDGDDETRAIQVYAFKIEQINEMLKNMHDMMDFINNPIAYRDRKED